MVINYVFFTKPRLFQTLFSEQEDHIQAHSQSIVGFIVFHFNFSPKSRDSGCIWADRHLTRERQLEVIDSRGWDFQRPKQPCLKGQSPVVYLLSFTCV